MTQAIITKYHGPTNTRGSRISAACWGGKVSVSYDHGLNATENHEAAAGALIVKMGWSGQWTGGGTPDERGYAFVKVAAGALEVRT